MDKGRDAQLAFTRNPVAAVAGTRYLASAEIGSRSSSVRVAGGLDARRCSRCFIISFRARSRRGRLCVAYAVPFCTLRLRPARRNVTASFLSPPASTTPAIVALVRHLSSLRTAESTDAVAAFLHARFLSDTRGTELATLHFLLSFSAHDAKVSTAGQCYIFIICVL